MKSAAHHQRSPIFPSGALARYFFSERRSRAPLYERCSLILWPFVRENSNSKVNIFLLLSLNFRAKIEYQIEDWKLGTFFPIIFWRQSLWSKNGYYEAYKDGITKNGIQHSHHDSLFRILQTIHLQNMYVFLNHFLTSIFMI